MASDVLQFGFVVEGAGEVEAVPLLIRRICHELFNCYSIQTSKPVRITKSKLLKHGELERAVQLTVLNNDARGPVVVILDADDDCPAELGPGLHKRGLPLAARSGICIVVAKREFEAWFLAAAQSLAGVAGLRKGLSPPPHPEEIRGAKEWLDKHMEKGRKYSPTVDQATLVARMDLSAARSCPSFDRLCRRLEAYLC